jgi:hypothetical protein
MIKLFNLSVIDSIFKHEIIRPTRLTPKSQMVYINCLTYHFKELEPSVINSMGFELSFEDNPKLKEFMAEFYILEDAGLVNICSSGIAFKRVWANYIDTRCLETIPPINYVGAMEMQVNNDLKKQFMENEQLIELCAMKYKISKESYSKMVELFLTEQIAFGKKYINLMDCLKHFTFWIPNNLNAVNVEKKKPKLLGE